MNRVLCGIVFLALISEPATPQDKKDRGRTPELTKKYVAFMEANNKEMKGIQEDIEKEKPEADIKKRLERIRENAAKARELKYRKDEDEAEKLEGQFDVFELKIKLDFEGVAWENKERRLFLLERLQAKCDVC